METLTRFVSEAPAGESDLVKEHQRIRDVQADLNFILSQWEVVVKNTEHRERVRAGKKEFRDLRTKIHKRLRNFNRNNDRINKTSDSAGRKRRRQQRTSDLRNLIQDLEKLGGDGLKAHEMKYWLPGTTTVPIPRAAREFANASMGSSMSELYQQLMEFLTTCREQLQARNDRFKTGASGKERTIANAIRRIKNQTLQNYLYINSSNQEDFDKALKETITRLEIFGETFLALPRRSMWTVAGAFCSRFVSIGLENRRKKAVRAFETWNLATRVATVNSKAEKSEECKHLKTLIDELHRI